MRAEPPAGVQTCHQTAAQPQTHQTLHSGEQGEGEIDADTIEMILSVAGSEGGVHVDAAAEGGPEASEDRMVLPERGRRQPGPVPSPSQGRRPQMIHKQCVLLTLCMKTTDRRGEHTR